MTRPRSDLWNAVPIPPRVAARAVERVIIDAKCCWISDYSIGSHGYAQIGWVENGVRHMALAHRAAWVHAHGQLPLGMTLDHTCKQKLCVNPSHLRALPNFENARRTDGRDWPMGECANGHANARLRERTDDRGLICGECRRLHVARHNWRKRHPGSAMPERLLLSCERLERAS